MKKREVHPQYSLFLPYWIQTRIFTRGMNDVKEYIQNVTSDTSPKGRKRNREYKDRACYVNFPARTRNAFTGAVFRKPANVEIPTALEFLLTDVDGSDLSLEHLAKSTVINVIECGRHGLFVDYDDRAKIVQYTAENVTNWSCDSKGRLKSVELKTGHNTRKELEIEEDGFYCVEEYDGDKLINRVEVTKADGSRFDYIPFVFVGSVNNSPDVDDMPLWAIVDLSRGHLQNSADMEDIAKYMIPTPAVTAPNASWVAEMLPQGVYTFGDGSVIPLPDGGTATLLQAQENQMHSKLMEQKEAQLVKIGARIMTGDAPNKTATAIAIEYSSENSVLDNLVGNVETAIKWCIEVCGEFTQGADGEVIYKLNRSFYDEGIDPQAMMAAANLLDRQVIGITDMRGYARRVGLTERSDEDIEAELSNGGAGM